MGLDQYLTKKIYVGAEYKHRKVTGKVEILVNGNPLQINFNKISEIEERVGYWRKANHIHKWFVDNVQDGEDDCKEYYVSHEQLQELVKVCQLVIKGSVLEHGLVKNGETASPETGGEFVPNMEMGKVVVNPELAEELLPTASGFLFGNNDYNEWYIEDCKETIEMLTECIKDKGSEFYYSSSW